VYRYDLLTASIQHLLNHGNHQKKPLAIRNLQMPTAKLKPIEYAKIMQNTQNNSINGHFLFHTDKKRFECSLCPNSFTRLFDLQIHRLYHAEKKTFHEDLPYKCFHCLKSFRTSSSLKTHLRIHTGEKPFECRQCSNSFSQSSSLKRHLRTHTGEKPFKCQQCPECFVYSTQLKQHLLIHTGEHRRMAWGVLKGRRWLQAARPADGPPQKLP
jgi:uncharacterized Zn-finger protein